MRVNRKCKLPRCKIQELNLNLKVFVNHIPKEFQKKKLDLDTFNYWKATQFRIFLNYCGTLVQRKILPKKMYHHFLLFIDMVLSNFKIITNKCSIYSIIK